MSIELHGVQSIANGQFCPDCGDYIGDTEEVDSSEVESADEQRAEDEDHAWRATQGVPLEGRDA